MNRFTNIRDPNAAVDTTMEEDGDFIFDSTTRASI